MKEKAKNFLLNLIEKLKVYYSKKIEFKKMKDKRRQLILSNFVLTKEQEQEIDDFFLKNLGRKVPYDWHRYYASYTGKFHKEYFPELFFIPVLQKLLVPEAYKNVLTDKNFLPIFLSSQNYIKTPKIYISRINNIYINSEHKFISEKEALETLKNIGKVFLKPTTETGSGVACKLLNVKDGIDLITNESLEKIINNYNSDFNFQEVIKNVKSINRIHPESLNTFRIITYCLNGQVYHVPVAMRIGRGKSYVDNAHQGGMFIHVDDEGNLGECAFTEFQERFYEHPDSHIRFKGYKIPEVKKCIEAVEKLQQLIPQVGLCSWDATVDNNGNVVIVEVNLKGQSIWFPQMASGEPAFGENTAEILKMIKNSKYN